MQGNITTIAAIDFGSHRIKGALAQKDEEGKFEIQYYADELSEGCIPRGVIYNMEIAAQKTQKIIHKLEELSGEKIARIYVNVGGQSLRTLRHMESLHFDTPHEITKEDINQLFKQVEDFSHEKYEVLYVDSPEYFVNSNYTSSPVGVQAMKMEARFPLIVAKPQMYSNVMSVVEGKLKLGVEGPLISPIVLGNAFLTNDQKNLGCVLIDLGAGTSTVSVFKKGLLQGVRVVPLGGNNITKDLTAMHITESEAERIKCFGGSAISEPGDKQQIEVNAADNLSTKSLSRYEVCRYIEARAQEIADNIRNVLVNMIRMEDIGGGVLVTGGGSELVGMIEKLSKTLGVEIELAANMISSSGRNREYIKNPRLHLLYAMLDHGTVECLVKEQASETVNVDEVKEVEESVQEEGYATNDYPENDLLNENPPVPKPLFTKDEIPEDKTKKAKEATKHKGKQDAEVRPPKRKTLVKSISEWFTGFFPDDPSGEDEI